MRMKALCISKRLGATDAAVQHQIPDDQSPKVFMHLIFCIELIVRGLSGKFPNMSRKNFPVLL